MSTDSILHCESRPPRPNETFYFFFLKIHILSFLLASLKHLFKTPMKELNISGRGIILNNLISYTGLIQNA
jgi:hypothetical protein